MVRALEFFCTEETCILFGFLVVLIATTFKYLRTVMR